MEEKKLTQIDIANLLQDKIGMELKSATLSRYNKNGLIFMPKRFSNYFNGISRIYFHFCVPVEIATAYLLFRGDWLTLDSEFRLSRASTQDVFLGRLLFYLYQYDPSPSANSATKPNLPLSFTDFQTSTSLFPTEFEGKSKIISMTRSGLESYVSAYRKKYLNPFTALNIEEPYLQHIENIYRATFMHLYKTFYSPSLRIIPDNIFFTNR